MKISGVALRIVSLIGEKARVICLESPDASAPTISAGLPRAPVMSAE